MIRCCNGINHKSVNAKPWKNKSVVVKIQSAVSGQVRNILLVLDLATAITYKKPKFTDISGRKINIVTKKVTNNLVNTLLKSRVAINKKKHTI